MCVCVCVCDGVSGRMSVCVCVSLVLIWEIASAASLRLGGVGGNTMACRAPGTGRCESAGAVGACLSLSLC